MPRLEMAASRIEAVESDDRVRQLSACRDCSRTLAPVSVSPGVISAGLAGREELVAPYHPKSTTADRVRAMRLLATTPHVSRLPCSMTRSRARGRAMRRCSVGPASLFAWSPGSGSLPHTFPRDAAVLQCLSRTIKRSRARAAIGGGPPQSPSPSRSVPRGHEDARQALTDAS